jgi:hypothetical protein
MDLVTALEAINEARACILNAAKIDAGRRALEGDLQSAYDNLEEARDALNAGQVEEGVGALAEALDLLRSDESRLIASDLDSLDEAIRLIDGLFD